MYSHTSVRVEGFRASVSDNANRLIFSRLWNYRLVCKFREYIVGCIVGYIGCCIVVYSTSAYKRLSGCANESLQTHDSCEVLISRHHAEISAISAALHSINGVGWLRLFSAHRRETIFFTTEGNDMCHIEGKRYFSPQRDSISDASEGNDIGVASVVRRRKEENDGRAFQLMSCPPKWSSNKIVFYGCIVLCKCLGWW